MKIRTNVNAGLNYTKIEYNNHNEKQAKSLAVKTGVKAGINFTATVSKSSPSLNHNEALKGAKRSEKKLRLSKETIRELKDTDLKRIAGGEAATGLGCTIDEPFIRRTNNHNEKLMETIADLIEKKRFGKKLRLSKETIRELKSSELKLAAGGARYSGTPECSDNCGVTINTSCCP